MTSKYDSDLKEALCKYSQAICGHISERKSPNEYPLAFRYYFDMRYRHNDNEENLPFQINELPEASTYNKAIKEHPTISKQIDTGVGISATVSLVTVWSVILEFMHHLVIRQRGTTFDSEKFELLFQEMMAFFESETIKIRDIFPIENAFLTHESPVMLSEYWSIGRIGLTLPSDWMFSKSSWKYSSNVDYSDFYLVAIVKEYDSERIYGDKKRDYDESDRNLEELGTILSSLRILKEGIIVQKSRAIRAPSWHVGSPRENIVRSREPKQAYMFSENESDELRVIIKELEPLKSERRIQIAQRRLRYSTERNIPEDKIIDSVIGLEALFLKGWSSSKTTGISERVAALLGSSLEEQEELSKKMKHAWTIRSIFTHAFDESDIDKNVKKMGYTNLDEVSHFLENTLRCSLRIFLQEIPKGGSVSDVLSEVDETEWMLQVFKKQDGFKSLDDLCFEIPRQNLSRTFAIEEDAIGDWIDVQDHWGALILSLNACYENARLTSNIVYRQFTILSRNLRWHTTAIMSGAYESAARDLRYILEDMCQSLYLEQNNPDLTHGEIYEKLKKKRPPRGKKLITALELPETVKRGMYDTMDRLHSYAHPSYEQIMENIEDIKIVLFHKHEWFVNLRELHREVADFVLCIVLKTFPDARTHFLSKSFVESSLQQKGFKYTLNNGR